MHVDVIVDLATDLAAAVSVSNPVPVTATPLVFGKFTGTSMDVNRLHTLQTAMVVNKNKADEEFQLKLVISFLLVNHDSGMQRL